MPSGAKKRKAAKKKKEKVASSSSPHGDDDLKKLEEKESDSGETNSPLSQDHNQQHFAEGYDKREEDTSSIQIDRDIKLDNDYKPEDVTIEHVKHENKSSSSSSSSSGSDDESKSVDKNVEVIDWEDPIEYGAVNLENTSDLPEITQGNDVVSHNLAVVAPNEESFEAVSAEDATSISAKPADFSETDIVLEPIPVIDDHDLVKDESKGGVSELVSEIIPRVESAIDEELGVKVNGKSEISEVLSSGSQSKVDLVSTKATEDGEITKTATVEENESKTLPQSSVNGMNTANGAENKKESEIEGLNRETPVAFPLRPVQTTSSMGCCGLFELFKGSNR